MAETERPPCTSCSVMSFGGYSIKVALGDGNCAACVRVSRQAQVGLTPGSKDGVGAGDHDLPYRFGYARQLQALRPFTDQQHINLMRLRAKIQDRKIDMHNPDPDGF